MQMLRAETVRITLAELFVQVLTYVGEFLGSGIQELEVVDLHHHGQIRHLFGQKAFPDNLVHKEDAGLGVVHQIVDIAGLELVQDGNGHGAVSDGGQETHAPVGLVAGADGHLVSFLEAALLKGDVQLGNPQGNLTVCQGHALVVGNSRAVPIFHQAFLKNLVYRLKFHYSLIGFSST